MDYCNDSRHILVYLASLATLLTHFVVDYYIHSQVSKLPNEKTSWNAKEVKALVHYLHTHHAEAGNGGNFKTATFNAAADHLAPFWTAGATKVGQSIKNKRLVENLIFLIH